MTMEDFAARWRLRVKRDEDGEPIMAGRLGHLYDHGEEGLFGVMLMPGKPFAWAYARKKLEAAGCLIWQDAEQEGAALFNPMDKPQCRLAIKLAGVKRVGKPRGRRFIAGGVRGGLADSAGPRKTGGGSAPEAAISPGVGVG